MRAMQGSYGRECAEGCTCKASCYNPAACAHASTARQVGLVYHCFQEVGLFLLLVCVRLTSEKCLFLLLPVWALSGGPGNPAVQQT